MQCHAEEMALTALHGSAVFTHLVMVPAVKREMFRRATILVVESYAWQFNIPFPTL